MRKYTKDLKHLTTFRLSEKLRNDADKAADYNCISFSAFVRQSLWRNILAYKEKDGEVIRKRTEIMTGNGR